MTTNFHDPIANNAPANAATINYPLGQLDEAISGLGFNNFTATAAPTVNDDASAGYVVGSRWFTTTTGASYVCTDASVGAAVWVLTNIESNMAEDYAFSFSTSSTSWVDTALSTTITTVGGKLLALFSSRMRMSSTLNTNGLFELRMAINGTEESYVSGKNTAVGTSHTPAALSVFRLPAVGTYTITVQAQVTQSDDILQVVEGYLYTGEIT